MNILISAYAVSPNHGSEPGVGWNWVIQLAKYCKVIVITESEFESEITLALKSLPQRDNLVFKFISIGEKARAMCWNQGDWRFYSYYRLWQFKVYKMALDIVASQRIDLIHQLNMIGYREPGFLWKINTSYFVWGPVGGFNFVRFNYLVKLGWKGIIFYSIKNTLNYLQARTSIRVKRAAKRANLVLAASTQMSNELMRFYNKPSIVMNETGCISVDAPVFKKNVEVSFNILWVGRFIPTKMLNLALHTISSVKDLTGLKFHIVGSGSNDTPINEAKQEAIDLGISNLCVWYGHVTQYDVQTIMRNADLLFFPSIVEGTSHVVLESISNALPVLCFDICGAGEVVTEEIGRKIPLTNPKESQALFAEQIRNLYSNRDLLTEMSISCHSRIHALSWEQKGRQLFSLYEELIKSK